MVRMEGEKGKVKNSRDDCHLNAIEIEEKFIR